MSTVTKEPLSIPLSRTAHLEGCPGGRVEHYEATRPATGKLVVVVRCMDCGGQEVHDGGIARLARKFTAETNEGKSNVRHHEPGNNRRAGSGGDSAA